MIEAVLAALSALAFVLLAQAFVGGGQVVAIDDDVSRWAADSVPTSVESLARAATWLGGAPGKVGVLLIVSVVLLVASRRADAVFVLSTVLAVTVTVPILKAVYERARPAGGNVVDLPHSYSFPSGHAATAVALYGAIGLLAAERSRTGPGRVAWLALALLIALVIGASRVLLNVHFVSDVAAGFAVGLMALCCCAIVRDTVAVGVRSG